MTRSIRRGIHAQHSRKMTPGIERWSTSRTIQDLCAGPRIKKSFYLVLPGLCLRSFTGKSFMREMTRLYFAFCAASGYEFSRGNCFAVSGVHASILYLLQFQGLQVAAVLTGFQDSRVLSCDSLVLCRCCLLLCDENHVDLFSKLFHSRGCCIQDLGLLLGIILSKEILCSKHSGEIKELNSAVTNSDRTFCFQKGN